MKKYNPFRAIRQFERLLFNSAPDRPEPTWQRNSYGISDNRLSGRLPQQYGILNEDEEETITIGYFKYDHENQSEEFVSSEEV